MDESKKVVQELHPEVGSVYSYGWQVIRQHFWNLLLIIVIGAVLGAFSSQISRDASSQYALFSSLFWVLVSGPVSYGIYWVFLKAVRNEDFEIKDMFAAFGPDYWNVLVTNLLLAVIVALGVVFFIIPGIYLACKLAFVPYLVMDRRMKFSDAMSASWDMTKGYSWKIFLMILLAIPIGIAGLIALGVGILVSIMWIQAAFAAMFYVVTRNEATETQKA